jgi:hypothetical protein
MKERMSSWVGPFVAAAKGKVKNYLTRKGTCRLQWRACLAIRDDRTKVL